MPAMTSPSGLARQLLSGVLLALHAAVAVPAAPSLYTVEIIVFRSDSTAGALSDKEVLPTVTDDSIEATPAATGKLNAAAVKLRAGGGFEVLAHTAWTQGPTAWSSRQGVSASQLRLGNGLAGKISLERGERLMHLRVDLTMENGGRRYRINEVRNVKPDEVHYFDHPAIGMLAIVSAVR
jgi:hypothetical protein